MFIRHLPAGTFLGMGVDGCKDNCNSVLPPRSLPSGSQGGQAESASSADHPVILRPHPRQAKSKTQGVILAICIWKSLLQTKITLIKRQTDKHAVSLLS